MRYAEAVGSKLSLAVLLLLQATLGFAGIWRDAAVSAKATDGGMVYFRALQADHDALQQALAAAPLEFTASRGAEIVLPMPNGDMQRFEVENSPIMAPELAARYPEIQTFRVRGLNDSSITGRLDLTSKGFHAMLSGSQGSVFIDPDQHGGYRSYYRKDYVTASKAVSGSGHGSHCLVESSAGDIAAARPTETLAQRISGSRRVYRLALAATGEYTEYHGGTVADALSAMVTAINRVNQIYGRDTAIQFVLVSNTDSVIFTDGDTDPYSNSDGLQMLSENQTTLDSVIGSINYDIGHVFSTGGGGIAIVGSTCRPDYKAQGVTGRPDPDSDLYYIDLVAHEIGHQMDAQHSFNGTTLSCVAPNRIGSSAVEPGSGSTIMSYAGICGAENLQDRADAVFHSHSIQQILDYSFSPSGAGSSCGTLDTTGNTAPSVSGGVDYVIPRGTPFRLEGAAADPDGDALSYQWDQMDTGTATDAGSFGDDLGDNPLFRAFLPIDVPVRIFPRLSSLLAGDMSPIGETLPATDRSLNFRLTVRDGESGVAEDDVTLVVETTQGPFAINGGTLNTSGSYAGGTAQTIDWSVNNTDTACPLVDISLYSFSSDGSSYCDANDDAALNLGTHANSGTATVTLLDKAVSRGRVQVACSDNVFFALSAADIEVTSTAGEVADDCQGVDGVVVAHGTVFNDAGEGTTVVDSDGGGGGGGGALLLLPALLGFRLAASRTNPSRRAKLPGA